MIGYRYDRPRGHVENRLVGMQRKNDAALQVRRPRFDAAHRCVAVLDGKWKATAHEWRAHPLKFARRHASGQHEALRAAANAAMQCADLNLARPRLGERLLP